MLKKAMYCLGFIAVIFALFACADTTTNSPGSNPDPGAYSRTLAQMDTERNNPYLSDLEKDMILELNKLRTNPVRWCIEVNLPTLDGITATEEFIEDKYNRGYTKNYPLPLLYSSKGLWLAAFDNNHNCQIKGGLGHTEWTGRVNGRYGNSGGGIGENNGPANIGRQASGGATEGAKIVNEMVRDRGVAGKGHRTNCMNAAWNVVGVSVAAGYVTYDFAGSFSDNALPASCNIAFAAIQQEEGNAANSFQNVIKLNFSKPVELTTADVSLNTAAAGSATIGAITGVYPQSAANKSEWYVFAPVSYTGTVDVQVTKTGVRPPSWGRVITVTRNSTFSSLSDFTTFLGSGHGHGATASDPVSVGLTGNALTGANDVAKLEALYAAIHAAGKYVNLDVATVSGLLTWPQVTSSNNGKDKITAIRLPMPYANPSNPARTSIGANAFSGFTNLTSVYSFDVGAVGNEAFKNCANLKTVTMSRTTGIGTDAFTGCTALDTNGAAICVGSGLTLTGTGLPAGMITKYDGEGKAGGYNSSGDVTYTKVSGVWTKVH